MKVKVIREFVDRHTDDLHPVGEVFDVTAKRLKEIQDAGDYVQEVKEDKPEKADKPERKTK